MKLHFLPLLAVSLLFGSISNAQVIISEIHYHPVEEPVFLADGTPALDLTDDVHEFVEIQNLGASAVNIGGWELSNGLEFTFPANTMIPAGGFRVVAKNPSLPAAVSAVRFPRDPVPVYSVKPQEQPDVAQKPKLPEGCEPPFSPVTVPSMAHVAGRCTS